GSASRRRCRSRSVLLRLDAGAVDHGARLGGPRVLGDQAVADVAVPEIFGPGPSAPAGIIPVALGGVVLCRSARCDIVLRIEVQPYADIADRVVAQGHVAG